MLAAPRPKAGRPVTTTPDQLRDRLVQAAIDLLSEDGPDADVSVARIAARAKVSKRTVYTVIASKEELIALVMRRGVEAVTGMLGAPVASPAAARALLARFLTQWAALACGPTAVGVFAMAIRERNRYPAIGAAYQNTRSTFGFQKLAVWLARMHAAQYLLVRDPAMASEFLLTMTASERQRQLALGLEAPMTDEELAQRVDAILQILFPLI